MFPFLGGEGEGGVNRYSWKIYMFTFQVYI